jgi:hypothetical protein
MRVNVGSINVSEDCANWIKIIPVLQDKSGRSFFADLLEEAVSRKKPQWLGDLELAAASRGKSISELWEYILENSSLPEITNPAGSLEKYIQQRERSEAGGED